MVTLESTSDGLEEHRPFRAWALQHDLTALLGGGSEWQRNVDFLGVDLPAPERPEDAFPGQAHLRQVLATDPRFELRTRTSLMLWAAALVTDVANQLSSVGLTMPRGPFWITIALVALALAFTAIVYPRLSPERFPLVEQSAMTFASLLIVYQCSATGDADSPYLIWFILTGFYVSYLMPSAQAIANLVWFSLLATATLLITTPITSLVVLQLVTLLVTMWVLGLALVLQRRREVTLKRAVTFLAMADPLTGAANTRAFEQYLSELGRSDGQRFAIVIADMNGLKGANAVFGHEIGDGMIARMGRLMFLASSERDQVARLGGDEFAVVIPGGDASDVAAWRERFENSSTRHNSEIRGRLPQISAAVGTAVYPDDGVNPAALIDVADRRMYEEKSSVVTPPHEIEGLSTPDAVRVLSAARLRGAPRHAVDDRERMQFAAANWVTCGLMALAAAICGGPQVHVAAIAACGVYGLVWAGCSIYQSTRSGGDAIYMVLDVATLLYALPVVWASGGANSPLLILISLPVAFYAQHFPSRIAWPRIAILIAGYSIGFWAFGTYTDAEITRYFTSLAAMLIVSVIMLQSSKRQHDSLALIRRSATRDELTGLPNVYALRRDLEQAFAPEAGDRPGAGLILIDVDDFRRVNTLAGHRGGDQLLRSVAERLSASAGEHKAYRVEGDEFAVLVCGKDADSLPELAREMTAAVEHEELISGMMLSIVASCGNAAARAGQSGDDVVDAAESALREQKTGRGRPGQPPGPVLL
ncbi:MAG: GGDEF domain-containing protein [Solirubrobacterales bacterium]